MTVDEENERMTDESAKKKQIQRVTQKHSMNDNGMNERQLGQLWLLQCRQTLMKSRAKPVVLALSFVFNYCQETRDNPTIHKTQRAIRGCFQREIASIC